MALLRRTSFVIVLIVLIVFTGGAWESAAEAPTSDLIRQTIRELADDDFSKREAAEQRLIEWGSLAAAELREAAKSADAEQRLRARELLSRVDQQSAWEATRLTLPKQTLPALDAFRLLEKKSANPFNWARSTPKAANEVTIEWKETPYWQALDELCKKSHLTARLFDDLDRAGAIVSLGELGDNPTSYVGPFRFRLLTLHRSLSQTVHFGDGLVDQHDNVQLSFELAWESKFPLCRYTGWPRVLEARTDQGEDLAIALRSPNALLPITRKQQSLTFQSRLKSPTTRTSRLTRLRTSLDLVAASDFKELRISELRAGATVKRDGYELVLDGVKFDKLRAELSIRWYRPVPYDKVNGIDMADEYLEVYDAEGAKLSCYQQQVIGDRKGAKYLVHVPAKKTPPSSLVYRVAVGRSPKTIEFQFDNVTLPTPTP